MREKEGGKEGVKEGGEGGRRREGGKEAKCLIFFLSPDTDETLLLTLSHNVTDGGWHSLSWHYNSTHLMATTDSHPPTVVSTTFEGFGTNTLPSGSGLGLEPDPAAFLYLGGLPSDLDPPQGTQWFVLRLFV